MRLRCFHSTSPVFLLYCGFELKFCRLIYKPSSARLDVLLRRGHALPLPNIRGPSLSFLTYLSARIYLPFSQEESNSSSMDLYGSNDRFLDSSPSNLRQILLGCLDNERRSDRAQRTGELLFATASLSVARNHPPSKPQASISVTSTTDVANPYFCLLHGPLGEITMNENPPTESVQRMLQYTLPTHDGADWHLDLHTCLLRTYPTASEPRGIWLTQSAAAAIGEVVGVSLLNGIAVPGVQGVPIITDEVHDPLGLGVNIGYSNASTLPKHSWFDHLVRGILCYRPCISYAYADLECMLGQFAASHRFVEISCSCRELALTFWRCDR